jgi:hypothetical protein
MARSFQNSLRNIRCVGLVAETILGEHFLDLECDRRRKACLLARSPLDFRTIPWQLTNHLNQRSHLCEAGLCPVVALFHRRPHSIGTEAVRGSAAVSADAMPPETMTQS